MRVTQEDIQRAIQVLELADQPVCIHASLRSFGHVEEGPSTVIQAFLSEHCTIVVPSFSSSFAVAPPPNLRPQRNGWDYATFTIPSAGRDRVYTPAQTDIDDDMGAIAGKVVLHPDRVRGKHPLNSFTGLGPLADELVAGQEPLDVYAPLVALALVNGFVLLMGVGLEAMTLLHLAEKEAGRTLFRRWANDGRGHPEAVEVGGCSDGFGNLELYLLPAQKAIRVGQSVWRLFPAQQALHLAAAAIRTNPGITHCPEAGCERCNDAVAGGPILTK